MVELDVDGVEPRAVVAWCANALELLDALRERGDQLPFRIPAETMFFIAELVGGWMDTAAAGHPIRSRTFDEEHVRQIVTYWFNITKLTAAELERLEVSFTPPEGRPFADALAAAVGVAMASSPVLADFARRLEAEWQECQPLFAKVLRS